MRPVEILALLVAGLGAIKMVVVFTKPENWAGVVRKTYGKPSWTKPIALVLAVIILNILLKEMTIIQIFAAMSFMMALMMVGVTSFGDEIVALSEKMLADRSILKKAWLSTSIWICLIVWVFYELLF